MGREPGRAGAGPRCGGPCRYRGGEPSVHRGTSDRHPAQPAGRARPRRCLRGRDRGPVGRQADQDGRSGHGQARLGRDGLPEEAARRQSAFGLVGAEADDALAPPAQDPALHPRQGAGPARLVPVDAVLAGRVGRQHRADGAVPDQPLCAPPRLARGAGQGADRLPGCGALPPAAEGADHHPSGRPAAPGRGARHGGPAAAAVLYPVGRLRPLRRGHCGL